MLFQYLYRYESLGNTGIKQICKKQNDHIRGRCIFGGRAGTRTLDPLIKSQLLYQLSYASRTDFFIRTGLIIDFFLSNASFYHNHTLVYIILHFLYLQSSACLPMSLPCVNLVLNNQRQTQHHAILPMPNHK